MAISETFLQELKYRCDLETVVSRYVNLKKSGRGFVGLCPFHSEKTPSFHIMPEEQYFHCFGCGAGGDVITFVERIENLDYLDAVRFLADLAGLSMPDAQEDDAQAGQRRRVLEMNRAAARFYFDVLTSPEGRRGLEYFAARKLSKATIRGFGLGYAPDRWDSLFKHLSAQGYSPEEMRLAALAEKGRSGSWYDKFRNRVMFPIIDVRGAVVGFGGRVLDDSKPKYLNSADTPVFKKSRCLYALNAAKGANNDTMILCEGYMDVIAMHQAGFKNAVATLGTALTSEQARLMARYAKQVIVSYDADEAGRKAAQRAIGILDEAGLAVRVLRIEGGKDPDEFIKTYGADKFRAMLEKSGGHVDFRLSQARAKYDLSRPEQKVEFLKEAAGILASLSSPLELDVYASRLSHELEVAKEALVAEATALRKKAGRNRAHSRMRRELSASAGAGDRLNPEKMRHLRAANAEEELIALLYNSPSLLREVEPLLSPANFVTDFNRRIYSALTGQIHSNGAPDLSLLAGQFAPDEVAKVTAMLVRWKVSNTGKEAKDLARVIRTESELAREAAAGKTEETAPDDREETRKLFEMIKKTKLEAKESGGNC